MAKNIYNNETFLSGRIGKLVYRTVRGKQVVSSYSKPRDPQTRDQQLVRSRYALLGRIASFCKYVTRVGFHSEAQQTRSHALARFMKANWPNISGSTPADLQVNWDDLVVAKGSNRRITLDSDHIDQTSVPGTISVAVQERGIVSGNYNAKDKCYLVAVCPEVEDACISDPVVRDEATELAVTPPGWWSGHKVYLYCFTTAPDNSEASESMAVGKIDFVIE
ncbi:MAG: hypothetical protein J6Y52_01055 [Bacteroidales bacterium]|nr:hypothetical protein [Bacteroidales bacterium]